VARTSALAELTSTLDNLDPTTLLVVGGVAVLSLLWWATRLARRTPTRRRAPATPRVGDVWWADVPFEDGASSKDRPCVVVETHGRRTVVLYVTSTDKTGRPGWLAMPRQGWAAGGGTSWLRTDRRVILDPYRLRRYAGPCPPPVRKALNL